MTDPASISVALASLKTASEIAKILTQVGGTLERAELKLKLADMYTALAEARVSVTDLGEELKAKDSEIARLLDSVAIKGEVEKRGDAYFKKDVNGKVGRDAFCVYCWDTKKKLIHIHRTYTKQGPDQMQCPECKTMVEWISIDWPPA